MAGLTSQATAGLQHLYTSIAHVAEDGTGSGSDNATQAACDEGRLTAEDGCFQPVPPVPLLGGRYRYLRSIGRGGFALLIRAEDTYCPRRTHVAIKVMHAQYSQLGMHEASVTRQINAMDPQDTCHVVRCVNTFQFAGHYCIVFELLSSTQLKHAVETASQFTNAKAADTTALKLHAIRKVAAQLLTALAVFREANVIHADLKPDNVLLRDDAANSCFVKVADFGNAINNTEEAVAQYYDAFDIQTPLYRAPEVYLGVPFGAEIDMWSAGCIVLELFLGHLPFTGASAEDVIGAMARLLGRFPPSYSAGKFFARFSQHVESRPSTPQPPQHPDHQHAALTARLQEKLSFNNPSFASFLAGLLHPSPDMRFTPSEALQHPFLAPLFPFRLLVPSVPLYDAPVWFPSRRASPLSHEEECGMDASTQPHHRYRTHAQRQQQGVCDVAVSMPRPNRTHAQRQQQGACDVAVSMPRPNRTHAGAGVSPDGDTWKLKWVRHAKQGRQASHKGSGLHHSHIHSHTRTLEPQQSSPSTRDHHRRLNTRTRSAGGAESTISSAFRSLSPRVGVVGGGGRRLLLQSHSVTGERHPSSSSLSVKKEEELREDMQRTPVLPAHTTFSPCRKRTPDRSGKLLRSTDGKAMVLTRDDDDADDVDALTRSSRQQQRRPKQKQEEQGKRRDGQQQPRQRRVRQGDGQQQPRQRRVRQGDGRPLASVTTAAHAQTAELKDVLLESPESERENENSSLAGDQDRSDAVSADNGRRSQTDDIRRGRRSGGDGDGDGGGDGGAELPAFPVRTPAGGRGHSTAGTVKTKPRKQTASTATPVKGNSGRKGGPSQATSAARKKSAGPHLQDGPLGVTKRTTARKQARREVQRHTGRNREEYNRMEEEEDVDDLVVAEAHTRQSQRRSERVDENEGDLDEDGNEGGYGDDDGDDDDDKVMASGGMAASATTAVVGVRGRHSVTNRPHEVKRAGFRGGGRFSPQAERRVQRQQRRVGKRKEKQQQPEAAKQHKQQHKQELQQLRWQRQQGPSGCDALTPPAASPGAKRAKLERRPGSLTSRPMQTAAVDSPKRRKAQQGSTLAQDCPAKANRRPKRRNGRAEQPPLSVDGDAVLYKGVAPLRTAAAAAAAAAAVAVSTAKNRKRKAMANAQIKQERATNTSGTSQHSEVDVPSMGPFDLDGAVLRDGVLSEPSSTDTSPVRPKRWQRPRTTTTTSPSIRGARNDGAGSMGVEETAVSHAAVSTIHAQPPSLLSTSSSSAAPPRHDISLPAYPSLAATAARRGGKVQRQQRQQPQGHQQTRADPHKVLATFDDDDDDDDNNEGSDDAEDLHEVDSSQHEEIDFLTL